LEALNPRNLPKVLKTRFPKGSKGIPWKFPFISWWPWKNGTPGGPELGQITKGNWAIGLEVTVKPFQV